MVTPTDFAEYVSDVVSLSAADTIVVQRMIDAVSVRVAAYCNLSATPTEEEQAAIDLAILIQVAELYAGRQTPTGLVSFGDFAVRVNQFHPHVKSLLAPFRKWGVG